MNKHGMPNAIRTPEPAAARGSGAPEGPTGRTFQTERVNHRRPVFRAIWFAGNLLLILSILLVAYSAAWEYATRRYLKGFSDAVVPASATVEAEIESILNWMSSGPRRLQSGPVDLSQHRDPIETLKYAALLKICGSATSAFVNLADSAGLNARRLLLLDSRGMTKHVVAEVLVENRWIVVDPAFRVILRDADRRSLTHQQLTDSAVFAEATSGIRGYSSAYTFDRTSHIRLSRLGPVGHLLRYMLDRLLPGWEDSPTMTLMVERESFTALIASVVLAMLLILLRIILGWYGDRILRIRRLRIRKRLAQVRGAFLNTVEGD